MAVTGTSTFTVTRDDIINATLRTLRVLGVGESAITEDLTNCSQALNIMLKSWAKKGFPLWVYTNLQVPAITGLTVYPIGPTAGYIKSVSSTGGTGYTAGTWTAVGGTTGTVASGTYTVNGSGEPDVFTVLVAGNSYTTAPTSFTLSGAGTGATITGVVAGVTTIKPMRVFEGYLRSSDGLDVNLTLISRQEYDMLGNKTVEGMINQLYYDPQLVNGMLYVFNPQSVSDYTINILIQRQFYDMTSGTDNFDFPQEWFQAIKWGLAAELALEYGVSMDIISYCEQKAEAYIGQAFDFSVEEPSVYFTVRYE
jgi:hypothetical protein